MTVGNQASSATVDQKITDISVSMRKVMQEAVNLSTLVNGQGTGLATLEGMGYDATDAASAQTAIAQLNTIAGVYFGTAAQTPAFDFNQELSQYWGGQ